MACHDTPLLFCFVMVPFTYVKLLNRKMKEKDRKGRYILVEDTEREIIIAFNKLLSKQDLKKITVSMIIAEAHVSRSTFYRYFKDKYDVMNANFKHLLNHYIFSDQCKNYRDMFFHIFDIIQTDWKSLKRLFESTGINSFNNYVANYSYEVALAITKENRDGRGFTPKEKIQCICYCYAVSEACKNWIQGECDLSADEMADALFELAPASLKHYWWKAPFS